MVRIFCHRESFWLVCELCFFLWLSHPIFHFALGYDSANTYLVISDERSQSVVMNEDSNISLEMMNPYPHQSLSKNWYLSIRLVINYWSSLSANNQTCTPRRHLFTSGWSTLATSSKKIGRWRVFHIPWVYFTVLYLLCFLDFGILTNFP